MYLHLGSDVVVSQSEIIAILDLDTTSVSKNYKTVFRYNTKRVEKLLLSVKATCRKVMCCVEKRMTFLIYISPLSAQTLYKRAAGMFKIE